MAIVFKCDKCEKVFDNYDASRWCEAKVRTWDEKELVGDTENVDLCEKCTKELFDFVKCP